MDKQAEHVRDRLIVRTSLVAIGTNLCLVAFKMAVGLLANSIAIVLDAMNNLSDALSSVITILGTKLAGRPPDKKHPFGYGRMEYLTGILIAGIILFAGVNFAVTSVQKIITPDLPHYSLLTVGIVAVAIVTKLLLGAYTKKMGRKTGSDALVASGTDATFDAVISAGTLVILKAGLELLLDTLSSIVGRRADSQLSQEIKQRLCTVDGILGAYDLVLHNYGPTRAMGSVNVAVWDWRTAAELHTLSKQAQALIWAEYHIFLYIGFYAVNTQDNALRALEDQIRTECQAYPQVLSIHAFFEEKETGTISFDAVIDFSCRDSLGLVRQIEADLAQKHPGRQFTIKVDRAYSD